MWFEAKRDAAPIYRDELSRRVFATASGRPKGADRLKKLRSPGEEKPKGLLGQLFRRRRRSSGRSSQR
jgi:hypothetical protein